MFISNTLQEFVTMTNTDSYFNRHSPALFPLSKEKDYFKGKGNWKSNSSLTKDQNYIIEIKNF